MIVGLAHRAGEASATINSARWRGAHEHERKASGSIEDGKTGAASTEGERGDLLPHCHLGGHGSSVVGRGAFLMHTATLVAVGLTLGQAA